MNTFQSQCIPCINFAFPLYFIVAGRLKTVPLRSEAAYTTTFNGCQGLTLARTVLDLRIVPFAHGQGSVDNENARRHAVFICKRDTGQRKHCIS
ncbi:hypothetical protein BDR04DRAFT_1086489 [Suillus decipiens]|nr:hypothetical protein BDR04DRAFT_1086489 [Suillus decipiens]